MADPLKPDATLLCKLGSIIVHADEGLGEGGHAFDYRAFRQLCDDPDVTAWLAAMDKMALIPKRRYRGLMLSPASSS